MLICSGYEDCEKTPGGMSGGVSVSGTGLPVTAEAWMFNFLSIWSMLEPEPNIKKNIYFCLEPSFIATWSQSISYYFVCKSGHSF
jgi:hypothetical protein